MKKDIFFIKDKATTIEAGLTWHGKWQLIKGVGLLVKAKLYIDYQNVKEKVNLWRIKRLKAEIAALKKGGS